MKLNVLLIVLLISFESLLAQTEEKFIQKGEKFYAEGSYAAAIEYFEQAYSLNQKNGNLNYQIGLAYLKSTYKVKSLKYLLEAEKLTNPVPLEMYLNIGKAFHVNLQFDKALEYYKKSDPNNINKKVISKVVGECEFAKKYLSNPQTYKIANLGDRINTQLPEYYPHITSDFQTMYFTGRRPDSKGGKLESDGIFFEDIYQSMNRGGAWDEPKNMKSLNSEGHDACIGLSKDGQTMYIYKDANGGDIYESLLDGEQWTTPKAVPFNTEFFESSVSVSADGKKMYFCGKDRFDNYGGEDIYVSLNKGKSYKNTAVISSLSTKSLNEAPLSISADGNTMFLWSSQNKGDIQSTTLQKNGSWSAPVTLPYPVNSDYYEGDAMLSADGNSIIFVSSRPGGYNLYTENTDSYHGDDNYPTDIYLCKRMYGNNWSEPINLGKKINTPFSERSPYLHPDGKTLYFSSDGHTGFGRMDVFKSIRQNDSTFHEWSKPLNLGKEINSTTNDWGFKFATDGSHAYYSGSANSAQKSSLLLVLDISGSMDGTKLDAMKKAAKELCLNALENNTEIAIYAFEGECEMPISDNIDFTNDPSELTFFIDELTALGGTPMYEALKDGLLYLKENSALDSKNKSIILLSDGDATSCISRDELFMNIRKEKTFQKVFTIALEVSENSQAFQDLKAISIFTKGEFYHAESSEDLGDAFAKASNTIFNFSSKNSNSDLYKIQIPSDLRPAIVSTISGIIMSTSKQPIEANILWEDLSNGQKIGSAKSNPVDGSYFIALPTGKNYGYFVDHPDYFPTSNNVDLRLVSSMQEIILDISPVSYDEMIKQSIAVAINNIFFETNKFDLKYESNSELDRVIEILKRVHFLGIKLEISGHTDNVGEADFNMELSRKRAEAVANYIIKQGFDPSSLEVKGYGLTRPVKDNSTVYNRSKNRRVELRVISKN